MIMFQVTTILLLVSICSCVSDIEIGSKTTNHPAVISHGRQTQDLFESKKEEPHDYKDIADAAIDEAYDYQGTADGAKEEALGYKEITNVGVEAHDHQATDDVVNVEAHLYQVTTDVAKKAHYYKSTADLGTQESHKYQQIADGDKAEALKNKFENDLKRTYHRHPRNAPNSSDIEASPELLNTILNCRELELFIETLKNIQSDLLFHLYVEKHTRPFITEKGTSPLVSRARLSINKLRNQVRDILKSCFPDSSMRDLLRDHINIHYRSRSQARDQMAEQFLGDIGSVSMKGKTKTKLNGKHPIKLEEGLSNQTKQSKSDVVLSRQSNESNSDDVLSKQSKQSKLDDGSLKQQDDDKLSHGSRQLNSVQELPKGRLVTRFIKRVNRLAKRVLKMLSGKKKINVVMILHKLIELEEEQMLHSAEQSNSKPGVYMTATVKGQLREVPPYYLSVAIGARIIQRGELSRLAKSRRFLNLARGLSPSVLRYGGTYANFVFYDPTKKDLLESSTNKSVNSDHLEEETPTEYMDRQSADDGPPGVGDISSVSQGVEDINETILVQNEWLTHESFEHKKVDSPSTIKDEVLNDSSSNLKEASVDNIEELNTTNLPSTANCFSQYRFKFSNDSTYNLLDAIIAASETGLRTPQDQSNLFEDEICSDGNVCVYNNFTMTAEDWATLNDMAKDVNMKLLFDLNQLFRTSEHGWDSANARMIFREAVGRKDSVLWQLGNEPNAYYHKFQLDFSGHQDAQDFHELHQVLLEFFDQPDIIGPDVTRPHDPALSRNGDSDLGKPSMLFLEDFLSNLNINLTAISWHQYYVDGRTATLEDFLSVEVLDYLSWQIPQVVRMRDELAPNTPIWLTETSSAWGGGAPGLSDRYADGFLWLDKLGLSAVEGVDMVARQSLHRSAYSLIDPDLNPRPSYWLSYVYKVLVGGIVIDMTMEKVTPTTRLYAHCQKSSSFSYEPGNIVVFGMNLANTSVDVKLEGIEPLHFIEQYLLEPPEGDLQSSMMMLNGEPLLMTPDDELPSLRPQLLLDQMFSIPPLSFGFWVVFNAGVEECFFL